MAGIGAFLTKWSFLAFLAILVLFTFGTLVLCGARTLHKTLPKGIPKLLNISSIVFSFYITIIVALLVTDTHVNNNTLQDLNLEKALTFLIFILLFFHFYINCLLILAFIDFYRYLGPILRRIIHRSHVLVKIFLGTCVTYALLCIILLILSPIAVGILSNIACIFLLSCPNFLVNIIVFLLCIYSFLQLSAQEITVSDQSNEDEQGEEAEEEEEIGACTCWMRLTQFIWMVFFSNLLLLVLPLTYSIQPKLFDLERTIVTTKVDDDGTTTSIPTKDKKTENEYQFEQFVIFFGEIILLFLVSHISILVIRERRYYSGLDRKDSKSRKVVVELHGRLNSNSLRPDSKPNDDSDRDESPIDFDIPKAQKQGISQRDIMDKNLRPEDVLEESVDINTPDDDMPPVDLILNDPDEQQAIRPSSNSNTPVLVPHGSNIPDFRDRNLSVKHQQREKANSKILDMFELDTKQRRSFRKEAKKVEEHNNEVIQKRKSRQELIRENQDEDSDIDIL